MMRGRRERRGQSLVEFALILPVFVLILVGIFDAGRAVYAYHTINNAAREGARHAIVDQTVDHIQERAASKAVALGVADDDVAVEFRLSAAPADDCGAFAPDGTAESDVAGIQNCMAVVRVPYAYQAVTPGIAQLMGTLNLVGESRFKLEFYCEGASCPLGE